MSRTKILAAAIAFACASTAPLAYAQDMKGHDHSAMQAETSEDNASTKAFKAANMKMHEGMAIEFSGDADIDFVRGMIAHHQGAIDMAKVELEHGKDTQMRKLAEDIITAQEKEIADMQAWLKAKGE